MTDTIRIAGPHDVPALYALLQESYAPLLSEGVQFTITGSPIERVAQAVASQTSFVIERTLDNGDTVLAATLTVRFPWSPDGTRREPWPFLHWFAVAPAFKRQGLGDRLLDHVETEFLRAQVKAPATWLATAVNHPWLPSLYERRGYVPFHHSTNARGTPLVWLRKILIPELYPQTDETAGLGAAPASERAPQTA